MRCWYSLLFESYWFRAAISKVFKKTSKQCCLSSESEMAKRVLRLSAHVLCPAGWCCVCIDRLPSIHWTSVFGLRHAQTHPIRYSTLFCFFPIFSSFFILHLWSICLRRKLVFLLIVWYGARKLHGKSWWAHCEAMKVLDIKPYFRLNSKNFSYLIDSQIYMG